VSVERPSRRTRFQRPERLLPFACLAAAGVLFASEFMTTFQLTEGDLGSGNPLCTLQATSRHHFALGILAIFAVVAVIVAVLSASKPAAMGVAIAGLLALLLFLIIDLPDANNVGTLGDSCSSISGQSFAAKAVPQAGFWLEMVGALALALSGAALATLTPDQLATLRPRWLGGPKDGAGKRPPPAATSPLQDPDSTQMGGGDVDAGSNTEPPADQPAPARRARRT
jgi:hypothetical protein